MINAVNTQLPKWFPHVELTYSPGNGGFTLILFDLHDGMMWPEVTP